MRIKKKELLEALDVNKTKNDLDSAKALIDDTKEFEDYAKTVVDPKVAHELAGAIVTPKEEKLKVETEEVKSKKRVKEVVKVKNLKK